MLKKIIIILNILPLFSIIGVYVYILIFYLFFGKFVPLDSKDLNLFFYRFITYSYGTSILLTIPMVFLLVLHFMLKIWNKDFIKNNICMSVTSHNSVYLFNN